MLDQRIKTLCGFSVSSLAFFFTLLPSAPRYRNYKIISPNIKALCTFQVPLTNENLESKLTSLAQTFLHFYSLSIRLIFVTGLTLLKHKRQARAKKNIDLNTMIHRSFAKSI